jgi:hypothetical protein
MLLESSVLLLAAPIMKVITDLFDSNIPFLELMNIVFVVTLLAFAGFSGLAMFRLEKKDKGFEYMLALPYPRWKLFIFKYLPRFLVLSVLCLLSVVFFDFTIKDFVVPLLLFQLGAVFLSLAFNSMLAAFVAVLLLLWFHFLSYKFILHYSYYVLRLGYSFFSLHVIPIIPSLFLLIPMGISFFLVFRNLDSKPYKYTVRPYVYVALPLILLQVVIVFFYYKSVLSYL